ncbi:MAG: Flp pilus assembly protein CpaB [Myxococcales bacterium]|jgi:pilus assembly protein CpaB
MLKGKTPLLIAIILGVLAGAFAYTAIKRQEKEVRAGWNLVPVIVANQDIAEGTVITYEMVSQRPIPEQFVTSSVVKPDSASYIVGQKVLVPLQTGDALLWSQFETSKAAEKLSTIVQKKGRALTLDVKGSKMSVGGWVRPNDHVDIIGSFRDPTSGENLAVTLMQNVVVLATGKITGTTNINLIPEGDREYQTISLLVLPEEAEILSLADDLGSLTFTLRNPEDIDVQEERGRATIQTLLTGERMKALQTLRYRTIQVIRGTEAKSGGSGGKAEAVP